MTVRRSSREVEFTKQITEYEKFLDEYFDSVFMPVLERHEKRYRKAVTDGYKKAQTQEIAGEKVIVATRKNMGIKNQIFKEIREITNSLEKELINSKKQEKLFDQTGVMGRRIIGKTNKLLAEKFIVNNAQFNSFINGYVSNVRGVLFNEPRRISEEVELNFGSQVLVNLAIEQAGKIRFNRNIYKLSTVTHAKSMYRNMIYNDAVSKGIRYHKVLVPTNKMQEVEKSPSGRTARILFLIMTALAINESASENTDGKTSSAIKGLGQHHGSYEYYMPIPDEDLEEEIKTAKQQRKEFIERLKKHIGQK